MFRGERNVSCAIYPKNTPEEREAIKKELQTTKNKLNEWKLDPGIMHPYT